MNDKKYMKIAIELAKKAFINGDIPVGAVLVNQELEIIGTGYNQKEITQNPTQHAEMLAIVAACKNKGTWRLEDCTIYVTLEPCLMCTGAILQARIKCIVYGLPSTKYGFLEPLAILAKTKNLYALNYRYEVVKDSKKLLQTFFYNLRN